MDVYVTQAQGERRDRARDSIDAEGDHDVSGP